MNPIRINLTLGLLWLLLGMLLGEHMGRTGDHGQMPTHAHIMLLGGVLSISWAVIYKVFEIPAGLLAWVQTGFHQVSTVVMITGLYMLYGHMAEEAVLGPVLGLSAIGAVVSVLLVLVQTLRTKV
ncbi:MAG: TonB-dependent receptor [Alphaproteobacteria bacterium]|uniref:TonB-dependent receptor n=1 Tax=Maricaulis alexandrii TaxID=2570354 RepID=UPI001108F560|nr:TonB-dependent receptor [Maricaulis alexandrii]MCR9266072.1 TonB-dependent receptor [Alphaproteobacteria bacterium]